MLLYLTHFCMGIVTSFIGTIPFGPINLTVINTTLKKDLQAGTRISVGAGITEILQASIALTCGVWVVKAVAAYPVIKLVLFAVFVFMGLILFLKKNKPGLSQKLRIKVSDFIKGAIVGVLNPQAIPFWVFILTYFHSVGWLDYYFGYLIALLLGVSIGKFLALFAYALLSMQIAKKITSINTWMNKFLGSVFIFIGLIQIIQYIWNY